MNTSVQTPVGSPTRNKPRRTFGTCAGCQTTQLVRLDGLIAKHPDAYSAAGDRCSGSDTTPIPLPHPADETTIGCIPTTGNPQLLDRWDFLSMPLRRLIMETHTRIWPVASFYVGYRGDIRQCAAGTWHRWELYMPIGQDPLERDLCARWMLAKAHGVDVSDWPMGLVDSGGAK